MRSAFLFFCLLFSANFLFAADSLQITMKTKTFLKGDTLEFSCSIPNFKEMRLQSATLNVWIEDVEKHSRWKFRYPILDGEIAASLAISDKIPDGSYIFAVIYFEINGTSVIQRSKMLICDF